MFCYCACSLPFTYQHFRSCFLMSAFTSQVKWVVAPGNPGTDLNLAELHLVHTIYGTKLNMYILTKLLCERTFTVLCSTLCKQSKVSQFKL